MIQLLTTFQGGFTWSVVPYLRAKSLTESLFAGSWQQQNEDTTTVVGSVWDESTRPPMQSKRPGESSEGAKVHINFFSDFWDPSAKGKEKEGNLKSPTTTTTRASRYEQWEASKPRTNRHHSRASRSNQWAAIGKGQGTELSLPTSKHFFIWKTSLSFTSKLHKR